VKKAACILFCLCACGTEPPASGTFVRVTVATATSAAQITRVSVVALPSSPAPTDLTRAADGSFVGTLEVPAGVAQTVTANAFAGSTLAATGSNAVTAAKGQHVPLLIVALDVTGAAPRPDHSPVITSLTASASAVTAGGQVNLSAQAIDADGDAISFAWTADPAGCGTFSSPASAATIFTAARVGTCVVIVTARAGGLSDSRGTPIEISADLPTPTLVQHLASTMNPPVDETVGNNYRFTLPNPVIAGNCLVLGISYSSSPTRTVQVTDNQGNAWPAQPAVKTMNATIASAIFVLPNARAGTTTIRVTFDRLITTFQYTVSEFNDIAAANPVSGTSAGQTEAPNLAVPALTPANNDANGGNLIWSYFFDNEVATFNDATRFTPAAGFTLLDADIGWTGTGLPHASQSFVQRKAAALTPAMTVQVTPLDNNPYNGVAVALRIAPAGAKAPSGGVRVNKIAHFTNGTPPRTWRFQFPTQGSLIVGIASSKEITNITSVVDSRGNTYVKYAPEDDEPQIWYALNATPDPDLLITVNSAGTPVNNSFIWYDISGVDGSPPDDADHLSGGGIDPGHDAIFDAPVIRPPSPGITIAAVSFGTGPSMGLTTGSPPDAIFDFVYYDAELDIDRMDNADGRAHLFNADLSTEHFNWILNHTMGTTASATALHFRGR